MRLLSFFAIILAFGLSIAQAAQETTSFGISEDGTVWHMVNVTLDSESWTKTYVNGLPIWIAGSEITPTAQAAMDADAASEPFPSSSLYETEGICECWQNSKRVGVCPCTGTCKRDGQPAVCTGRVVE